MENNQATLAGKTENQEDLEIEGQRQKAEQDMRKWVLNFTE